MCEHDNHDNERSAALIGIAEGAFIRDTSKINAVSTVAAALVCVLPTIASTKSL